MADLNIKKYQVEEYLPLKVICSVGVSELKEQVGNGVDDDYIDSLFSEDFEGFENVSVERKQLLIKRNRKIVSELKQKHGYSCQICGQSFLMDNGDYYCEAHHLVPLSENGSQSPENVIIVCANHHRMFHYAKNKINIGDASCGSREIIIDGKPYKVKL